LIQGKFLIDIIINILKISLMAETNPFENDPKMNDLWNEIPQGMREAQ